MTHQVAPVVKSLSPTNTSGNRLFGGERVVMDLGYPTADGKPSLKADKSQLSTILGYRREQ